jgi:hypothetical protein
LIPERTLVSYTFHQIWYTLDHDGAFTNDAAVIKSEMENRNVYILIQRAAVHVASRRFIICEVGYDDSKESCKYTNNYEV